MILKKQKKIKFNSPNEVVFDSGDLRKAILWYSDKPVARIKNVYLHGRYYAVSIYDRKIHIHRLLMMYWMKRELQRSEHVHHKDGNKFNNLKENLEILHASEHMSLENKGKKLTKEHRIKIAKANDRRCGVNIKRKYVINEGDLIDIVKKRVSINSVAKKYGCDWSTIKRNYDEFIYENPELLTKKDE